MASEYITKKIPKQADVILKYVQAHEQLEKGERVTEAQVIEMALEHVAEEKYGYLEGKKARKGFGLLKYAGFIKGGPKGSSKDIDKIVYGV
ncbi:hypothetical protein J4450_01240 [Candidatus Micrarchaeota archaeon]|nr:hypothetical protein [Candidatus Micrarchaeota archaeon]